MLKSIKKRDATMRKSKSQPTDSSLKSSAVEFLTFVAATGGETNVIDIRYENENLWLTQKLIAELYGIGVNTVNYHLRKLFSSGEMNEASVIRKFRITATDGKSYLTSHYSLQAIIAVVFKAENERAIQFRKWAAQILRDYTIQGWVMDTDRLMSGHMFTDEYFERQLATIREIRLSERKFYQKEVLFLGHIVRGSGVKVDPAKVQAVRDYPRPDNIHHLRSFLGMATYFRKFIYGFARVVHPLTDLLRKDKGKEKPWRWTEACEAAFCKVKELLTTAPVLALPDWHSTDPFELVCDASLKA